MNRILSFLLTFFIILGVSIADVPAKTTQARKTTTHKTVHKKGAKKKTVYKKGSKTTKGKKGGRRQVYRQTPAQKIYHFGQGQKSVMYPKSKTITYKKGRRRYKRVVQVPQRPLSVTFDGIDVSRHQGLIHWSHIGKTTRMKYVYVKATEGVLLKDVQYNNNIEHARAAGYKVGSYLYFRPNVSAKQQFENFKSLVKVDKQDLLPMLDIEEDGQMNKHLLQNRIREIVELFTDYYGQRPLIYTMRNFYNEYMANEYPDYPLMIGSYSRFPELSDGKTPVIWQFCCEGKISGINSPVDLSVFNNGCGINDIWLDKFLIKDYWETHPNLIRSRPIPELDFQNKLVEPQVVKKKAAKKKRR